MFKKVLILGVAVAGFATAVVLPLTAEPHGATAAVATVICAPGEISTNYCDPTSSRSRSKSSSTSTSSSKSSSTSTATTGVATTTICAAGSSNPNYCVTSTVTGTPSTGTTAVSTTTICPAGSTNPNYCVTTTATKTSTSTGSTAVSTNTTSSSTSTTSSSTSTTSRCPVAKGTVTGSKLGPFRLGMTRPQATAADGPSSSHGATYVLYFCELPIGYRIGFPSPLGLSVLPASQRGQYAGHVIWISTSNTLYKIDGITRGSSQAAAISRLKHGNLFTVGQNQWYLAPFQGQTAVFKIDGGTVQEIGIGYAALTTTPRARRIFASSFS